MTRLAYITAAIVATLLLWCAPAAVAQTHVDIVTHITAGSRHTITLPDSLQRLLLPGLADENTDENTDEQETRSREQAAPGTAVGYRVQVYSDNNARTAKNQARTKQRAINARFPQYRTYVRYSSPYWRVKVGDFRTQQEAANAAEELRRAFPAQSKEIRIVRDRINLNN